MCPRRRGAELQIHMNESPSHSQWWPGSPSLGRSPLFGALGCRFTSSLQLAHPDAAAPTPHAAAPARKRRSLFAVASPAKPRAIMPCTKPSVRAGWGNTKEKRPTGLSLARRARLGGGRVRRSPSLASARGESTRRGSGEGVAGRGAVRILDSPSPFQVPAACVHAQRGGGHDVHATTTMRHAQAQARLHEHAT